MGVLFLPKKSLICCNKRKHNVIFELHSEKRVVKIRKKIARQLVLSRTSLTIKHVEKGPKNTGNAPLRLSYKNPHFLQGLTRFSKRTRHS